VVLIVRIGWAAGYLEGPGMTATDHHIGEPMTVARLRAELAKFPADMPVVTATDEEGNGFCNLLQVEPYLEGEFDEATGTVREVAGEVSQAVVIWPLTLFPNESPQATIQAANELWTKRGGK
jgi:hypothetical protein